MFIVAWFTRHQFSSQYCLGSLVHVALAVPQLMELGLAFEASKRTFVLIIKKAGNNKKEDFVFHVGFESVITYKLNTPGPRWHSQELKQE